jgi:hypothetical protein
MGNKESKPVDVDDSTKLTSEESSSVAQSFKQAKKTSSPKNHQ